MSNINKTDPRSFLQNYEASSIVYKNCDVEYFKNTLSYKSINGETKYAKQFFIDARSHNHCKECFIKSKEYFDELVKSVCSYDFWSYTATDDSRRYNLYFMVIVEKCHDISFIREVQSDFNYARKFIFDTKMAIEFLSDNHIRLLTRIDNTGYLEALHEIYESYDRNTSKRNVLFNDSMEMRMLYFEAARYKWRIARNKNNWLTHIFRKSDYRKDVVSHYKLNLLESMLNSEKYSEENSELNNNNSTSGVPAQLMSRKKRFESRKKANNDDILASVERVKKIVFKNYKNFAKGANIDFALVNLLHGENGAGKTAILEAIEFKLTGEAHDSFSNKKWNKDFSVALYYTTSVSQCSVEELIVSKSLYKMFSECWYRSTHDSIDNDTLNAMFRKHNYFDARGAFRFASELNSETQSMDAFATLTLDSVVESLRHTVDGFIMSFDMEILTHKELLDVLNSIKRYEIRHREESIIDVIKMESDLDEALIHVLADHAIKSLISSSIKSRTKIKTLAEEQLDQLVSNGVSKQREKTLRSAWMNILRITLTNELSKNEKNKKQLKKDAERIQLNLESVRQVIGEKIDHIFKLLTTERDYQDIDIFSNTSLTKKNFSDVAIKLPDLSTGQKVCLSIATLLAFFTSNNKAPNLLIFDEPVAHLDPLHLLNLLDILRTLALSGTQIFFTASQPHIINLFKQKFAFLGDEFNSIKLKDIGSEVIVEYEKHTSTALSQN